MRNKPINRCLNKLSEAIITASGSQFVVAGIVLEDMHGTGVQNAYTFRDGVTVQLNNGLRVGHDGIIRSNDLERALSPAAEILSTASKKGPARIQSTTRVMYMKLMGSNARNVRGLRWLQVVRELYQDAWKRAYDTTIPETVEKYRNVLMVARCYALMGIPVPA